MREMVAIFLLLSGSGLILIAAIGLVRLPDVLCRGHAVAKALTLGIFLMLIGLWMEMVEREVGLKILLAIFFQVVTIPLASHLVALLAYQKNFPRWRERPMDEAQPRREEGEEG